MDKKKIGGRGEDIACRILEREGYSVVARNFHSRCGEIDIIAENAQYIAFVEVKTRSESSSIYPREAVGYTKQQKIALTAMWYLRNRPAEKTPMFDVVEIVYCKDGSIKYNHIKNAFDLSCLGGAF